MIIAVSPRNGGKHPEAAHVEHGKGDQDSNDDAEAGHIAQPAHPLRRHPRHRRRRSTAPRLMNKATTGSSRGTVPINDVSHVIGERSPTVSTTVLQYPGRRQVRLKEAARRAARLMPADRNLGVSATPVEVASEEEGGRVGSRPPPPNSHGAPVRRHIPSQMEQCCCLVTRCLSIGPPRQHEGARDTNRTQMRHTNSRSCRRWPCELVDV